MHQQSPRFGLIRWTHHLRLKPDLVGSGDDFDKPGLPAIQKSYLSDFAFRGHQWNLPVTAREGGEYWNKKSIKTFNLVENTWLGETFAKSGVKILMAPAHSMQRCFWKTLKNSWLKIQNKKRSNFLRIMFMQGKVSLLYSLSLGLISF